MLLRSRTIILGLLVILGLFIPQAVAPTSAHAKAGAPPESPATWLCVGGGPCPPPSVDGEQSQPESLPENQLAPTLGNVVTDEIWRYREILPYDLCDANGCTRVGEGEVTAEIVLNGIVHRVNMTARPIAGPRIQPILYRRCAAQNGALPDTTCAEGTHQSTSFIDGNQTYTVTTNYQGEDPDTYYYAFQWSWNVEGQVGTPASGLGQSHFFNCDGDFCSFP